MSEAMDWKVVPVSTMRGRQQFLSTLRGLEETSRIVFVFLYADDFRDRVPSFAEGYVFVSVCGESCGVVVRRFENEVRGMFGEEISSPYISWTCTKADLLTLFSKVTSRGGFAHGVLMRYAKTQVNNGSVTFTEHEVLRVALYSARFLSDVINTIVSSQNPKNLWRRKRQRANALYQPFLPFVW